MPVHFVHKRKILTLKLVKSFKAISHNRHNSVVIISHQERIMQLADEIVVVADGKVARQGPREEIFPTLIGEVSEGCGFGGKGGAQE